MLSSHFISVYCQRAKAVRDDDGEESGEESEVREDDGEDSEVTNRMF